MLTTDDVIKFIEDKNIKNSTVCLHASLKSFGEIKHGPYAIIDAFINTGCTLVCPSFFYNSSTYPIQQNYKNNGIDYSKIDNMTSISYNDYSKQIEPSMGIIPRTMLYYKNAVRTRNPGDSFVLIGNKADVLIKNQSLLNVYSIYKNIYIENIPAFIMLAGVSFTSCTPIHFAEEKAGRTLFRRWAVYNHQIVEIEVGSCSAGFEKLRPYTKDIEIIEKIGKSVIRIYPFKKYIDILSDVIKKHPEITHCDNEKCERCKDMINGGRKN